jgi:hypothetical protein
MPFISECDMHITINIFLDLREIWSFDIIVFDMSESSACRRAGIPHP